MCIEKKMEQFISGELKNIFRVSSHTLLIGLTVGGKYAWQRFIFDTNSCTLIIGLMKSGKEPWQEEEEDIR